MARVYVWNNSPEFMLYVIKDGKTIFADKTLVGTIGYATPVFTADMATIVFNPDWIAPETVVTERFAPHTCARGTTQSSECTQTLGELSRQSGGPGTRQLEPRQYSDAYTFMQKAGPQNVLGKAKFLFPNRHTVYMHDTSPCGRNTSRSRCA